MLPLVSFKEKGLWCIVILNPLPRECDGGFFFLVLEGLILGDTFKHFLACPIPGFFCFSVLHLIFFNGSGVWKLWKLSFVTPKGIFTQLQMYHLFNDQQLFSDHFLIALISHSVLIFFGVSTVIQYFCSTMPHILLYTQRKKKRNVTGIVLVITIEL